MSLILKIEGRQNIKAFVQRGYDIAHSFLEYEKLLSECKNYKSHPENVVKKKISYGDRGISVRFSPLQEIFLLTIDEDRSGEKINGGNRGHSGASKSRIPTTHKDNTTTDNNSRDMGGKRILPKGRSVYLREEDTGIPFLRWVSSFPREFHRLQ